MLRSLARRSLWLALAGLTACTDTSTEPDAFPARTGADAALIQGAGSASLPSAGKRQLTPDHPFTCLISTRVAPEWYEHDVKPISFTPEEVREANGRFGIFRYRLTDSDGVVRVINCRIPYSASAYASLAGRLDVTGEIRRQSLIPSIETFGDDEGCGAENNPCILPPIIVECNPGYDPECDEPEQPGGGGTYDGDWGDPGPAPCNPYFDSTCSGSGGGGAPCTNCNPPPATAPTGVPQEWYNTLTPAEKQLVWNSPLIDVYRVMAARDRAFEEAPQITPIGPHNGPQDAVRHALWSAYMANSMGAAKAKAWGDAHEDYPENPPDEKQMDLYNNQIGRQIGTTHSRDDIFEAVRAALQSGQLQTSLGAGGGGGGGDCGMLLCRQ